MIFTGEKLLFFSFLINTYGEVDKFKQYIILDLFSSFTQAEFGLLKPDYYLKVLQETEEGGNGEEKEVCKNDINIPMNSPFSRERRGQKEA